MVKSTCRGSRFRYQHLYGGLQPSISLVPGDLISSSSLRRHQAHTWYTGVQENTHTHRIKINNSENKVILESLVFRIRELSKPIPVLPLNNGF